MPFNATMPPFIVYLYAHKMCLFASYCIAFCVTEQDTYLGAIFVLLLLSGHVNFIDRVK